MKKLTMTVMMMFGLVMGLTAQGTEKAVVDISGKGTQAVYLELFGNAGVGTLNWDCFITDHLLIRVGGMIIPTSDNTLFLGTSTINWVLGKATQKLRFEVGMGIAAAKGGLTREDVGTVAGLTTTIGLRYQPRPKGLLLRLSFTPLIARPDGVNESIEAAPWGGLSIGYSF